MPVDLWETSKGGTLALGAKFKVSVNAAYFTLEAVRNPQQGQAAERIVLKWDATSDPAIPFPLTFSVGSGWQIGGAGDSIQWGTGQAADPSFHENSKMGQLIDHAKKAAPEWITALRAAGRSPDQAGIWAGTTWVMEVVDTGRERDDRKGNITALVPTKLLSAASGAPTAGAAPVTGAAGALAPAVAPPTAVGDLTTALTTLAKSTPTHDIFFQTAMADESLRTWIQNQGKLNDMLNSRADGFWARVHTASA